MAPFAAQVAESIAQRIEAHVPSGTWTDTGFVLRLQGQRDAADIARAAYPPQPEEPKL